VVPDLFSSAISGSEQAKLCITVYIRFSEKKIEECTNADEDGFKKICVFKIGFAVPNLRDRFVDPIFGALKK